VFVQRGQVLPSNHPVVKLDKGRGVLFRQLEEDPKRPVKARSTASG
jgi:hypothetical protein